MSTATETRLDKFIEADEPMEAWRSVWRKGFAPVLTTSQLEALKRGLESNDSRLIQGCTTTPPPLLCVQEWPIEAACAIGYAGWMGDNLSMIREAEEFFAQKCFYADKMLGEPAACRWFLNWFDDTDRPEAFRDLLIEVNREIQRREIQRRGAVATAF